MGWFEVDKGGLRQLLEGKSKSFIFRELVQNAWDEPGVTRCMVHFQRIESSPFVFVQVIDDAPEGFYDISHAFTLFAKTRKRKDVEARGRFNIGEKQVLALCRDASITTTKGTVRFLENGERKKGRNKTESGSIFEASIRMTTAEVEEAEAAIRTFLPPKQIKTTLNGEVIPYREPMARVRATLATEVEDEEGAFKPTRRATSIEIHEVLPGETAMIYEMGLPIIETGDRYHYDIGQRVPLTTDRDNVRPSFLRDVRAEVLNVVIDDIEKDEASEQWIREAGEDDRTDDETFRSIITKRFGEKRVVADPRDPGSRERAVAAGFHIVAPGSLSREEWKRSRSAEAIPSSSSLFATVLVGSEAVSEISDDMKRVAELAKRISEVGLGFRIKVKFTRSDATTVAQYGNETITFNVGQLDPLWFDPTFLEAQLELIIHELGHEYGAHLTASYYNGLAKIGARLAIADPKPFNVGNKRINP